uniref:Uncharacterized protein n=1 Tax=Arundo donax TaxID=35708 RepID=A0A0A8ZLE2_ARUDO
MTMKVSGAPAEPPAMPGPAAVHLEGSTGPGGAGASSSSESGEAASAGEGRAGSGSWLSSAEAAVRALKVASKAALAAAVVSASDLSLASSACRTQMGLGAAMKARLLLLLLPPSLPRCSPPRSSARVSSRRGKQIERCRGRGGVVR